MAVATAKRSPCGWTPRAIANVYSKYQETNIMMTQDITKQTTDAPEDGANFIQGFLSGAKPATNQIDSQVISLKEPLKHLLIGSSKAVTSTIHHLQVIGYAQVGDWSPLLPSPNPDEVMSILNRPIVVQ